VFDEANVLKMRVNVLTGASVVSKVFNLVKKPTGSYICVSNVHMCMEAFDSAEFQGVVNNSDLVVADGRPIYWAQKLLGAKHASQVRGQDLMEKLCSISGERSLRIGLYGGAASAVLDSVVEKLKTTHPGIKLVYTYSPPFRCLTEQENSGVINDINDAGVDVLFVGIGCPKQEVWMAEHKASLNCVMVGVGAAFDFIAGTKKHAPRYMQRMGLEWLFRLFSEPKRLGARYLKQNPRFIFYFSRQWLFGKQY